MKKRLFLEIAIFSFFLVFSFGQETADKNTVSTAAAASSATTTSAATDDSTANTNDTSAPAGSDEEGFIGGLPGSVDEEIVDIKGEEFKQAESFGEFIRSLDFIFDIGPTMYINAKQNRTKSDGDLVSGTSPSFDPVTIGILWPNYTFIAVEPSVSYFSMYYLWYDGMALPAEIEKITASTLCFMFNVPVVFQLYIKNVRFQISGGVGVLARWGLLAGDVDESDSGFTGTAGGDLTEINKWFWEDMHYMYLSLGFSFLVNLHGNVKAGPVFRGYLPFSMITAGEGFQGTILDIGLKISL